MNVFHNMDLALMFWKRQPSRAVSEPPLACEIIDGKTDKFDQRWPGAAFRFVFVIRPRRRPYSSQIDLSE